MKKNEIFIFTALNGVEVTAVVLDVMAPEFYQTPESKTWITKYLCYAQNRLFYYMETREINLVINDDYKSKDNDDYYYVLANYSHKVEYNNTAEDILVDYCVLPDYDVMLEAYSDHLVTMTEEQSGM